MQKAHIRFPTIRGEVQVSFTKKGESSFELRVDIPANMEAEIYLPRLGSKQKVTKNDQSVSYRTDDRYLVIENVGSGSYIFIVAI